MLVHSKEMILLFRKWLMNLGERSYLDMIKLAFVTIRNSGNQDLSSMCSITKIVTIMDHIVSSQKSLGVFRIFLVSKIVSVPKKICSRPVPVYVTLFGNCVSASIIKLR